MQFLYPSVFWFLLALAIPVIIHLFSFRKARRLNFSSLKNLKLIKKHSDTRNNLKKYLVLASRIMFLMLLIFCFAGPYIPSDSDKKKSNKVVLFIDNSPSMTIEGDDGIPLLDKAVGLGNEVISRYEPNTNFFIVTADEKFSPYNSLGKEAALNFLSGIQVTDNSIKLSGLIDSFDDQRISDADIYLISDFQNNFIDSKLSDTNQNYILIPMFYGPVANVSVDSVYLDKPVLGLADGVSINVALSNKGTISKENIPIRVELNGSQVGVAEASLNINDTEVISFDIKTDLQELNRGKVIVEDMPVSYDNEFFWSLNNIKKVGIDIVSSTDKEVFDALFVGNPLFDYNYFGYGSIDYQSATNSDLLVVNGLKDISTTLLSLIESRLNDGSYVLIIADNLSGSSSQIRQFLTQFGFSQVQVNDRILISKSSFSNPYLDDVFENIPDNLDVPWVKPRMTWRPAESILTLNNGMPVFGKADFNKPLYILSTGLTDSLTNLHKHGLFLPLMYKTAFYSSNSMQKLYFRIEEAAQGVVVDKKVAKGDVVKLSNGSSIIIPEVRAAGNATTLFLPIEANIEAGHYEVYSDESNKNLIAFNLGKEESDPSQLSVDSLKSVFSGTTVLNEPDVASVKATITKMDYGTDIWQWFLIGALLFLLIEILLIRMI
ncbi:BatA domain-containing protein [Marinigracilibium pacificum]|uniref:Aerotolerance regulator N-terminal domain-containing protein n=1 Tax=Marinigracilibium pacificum TaxID=2729599 RepID=A0A848J3G8_9BACT|nr:BatA domain-containing protein [Marinigracilibium pacificum]NMM50271.1 hypothetical protein [Marinigracilibium pacificum]